MKHLMKNIGQSHSQNEITQQAKVHFLGGFCHFFIAERGGFQHDKTIKHSALLPSMRALSGHLALILAALMLMLVTPSFAAVKQSTLDIEQVRSEYYQSGSGKNKIRDSAALLSGTLDAVDVVLAINSKIVMSSEQEQMLLNGIPLTFVYDIRLREKGFWSRHNYEKELRFLLFYHGLSKQFVVRNLGTTKQHSYPTLSLALLSISTPTGIAFSLKDSEGIKLEQYEGRTKLWLDIEALPTPLRIPAYLSSNWWLNSSWFTWDLTL